MSIFNKGLDFGSSSPYEDYFLSKHYAKDPIKRENDALKWLRNRRGSFVSGQFWTLGPRYADNIENLNLDGLPFNEVAYNDRLALDNEQTRRRSFAGNSIGEYERYSNYPELAKPTTQWEWTQGHMADRVLNNRLYHEQVKSLTSSPDSQEYFDHMVSVPDPVQYSPRYGKFTLERKPLRVFDPFLQMVGLKEKNYKIGKQLYQRNVHGYSDFPSWVQGQLDRAEIDRQRAIEEEKNQKLHDAFDGYMEQFSVID